MSTPQWLDWAQRLQALAQSGLAYNQANPFEIERYQAVSDIAAEMVASHSHLQVPKVQALFAAESGYATPKVDVRGVVFHENKILLVKELSDGGWTLPGGWADVGDTPSEAVEREVLEESGFKVKADKMLAFYDRNRQGHTPYIHHIYKVFFQCRLLGGHAEDSAETEGAAFFDRTDLPPLSIARVLPRQIQRFFDHLEHPEWPTDFD
jgi:ADP-ribose pyrophosphatase YjhB (NUDIX family)